jgi:hypothetical protein
MQSDSPVGSLGSTEIGEISSAISEDFFTHPLKGYQLMYHCDVNVNDDSGYMYANVDNYRQWLADYELYGGWVVDMEAGIFQLIFANCTYVSFSLYEHDGTYKFMVVCNSLPTNYFESEEFTPYTLVEREGTKHMNTSTTSRVVRLLAKWLSILEFVKDAPKKEINKQKITLDRAKEVTRAFERELNDATTAELMEQQASLKKQLAAAQQQLEHTSKRSNTSEVMPVTQHILRERSKFTEIPIGGLTEAAVTKLEHQLQVCEQNGDAIQWNVIFGANHQLINDDKFAEEDKPIGSWRQWSATRFIQQLKASLKLAGSTASDSTGVNTTVSALKHHATFSKGLTHEHIACNAWFDTLQGQVFDKVTEECKNTTTPEAMKILRDYVESVLTRTFLGKATRANYRQAVKLKDFSFRSWFKALKKHYEGVRSTYDTFNDTFYQSPNLLPSDHDVKLGLLEYRKNTTNTSKSMTTSTHENDEGMSYGESVRKKARLQKLGGKPPPKPTTSAAANSDANNICKGCGRKGHVRADCKLGKYKHWKGHPDFNYTDLPWKESPKGKAFAAQTYPDGKPILTLPFQRTLVKGVTYDGPGKDGTEIDWCMECNRDYIPYIPTTMHHLCVMCNDIDKINAIATNTTWSAHTMYVLPTPNCVSDVEPLRLRVLLDTGSLGENGNYVSQRVGKELVARGYKPKVVNRSAHTCNGKLIINESFDIKLTFSSSDGGIEQQMIVKCDVIDTTHDMIIGYETIKNCTAVRNTLINDLLLHKSEEVESTMSSHNNEEAANDNDGTTPKEISYLRGTRTLFNVMIDVTRKCKKSEVNSSITTTKISVDKLEEAIEACIKESTPTMKQSIRLATAQIVGVFSKELNKEPANMTPMEIGLKADGKWQVNSNSQPPRLQSRLKQEEIILQIDIMLESGVIRTSTASAYSQVMLIPKANGTWRFCIDYRRLNAITDPNRFPLPRIKQMLYRIGEKKPKFFGVLDLTKGYYQAPLSEASKKLTAFITPNGLYEWNRVAMGLTGAPGYFQRAMAQEVLREHLYNKCELYLDDIIVFGKTEEEFVNNLKAILLRLKSHNITVNPDKCKFGLTEVEYVGHTINHEGIHFTREKLQKAIKIPRPETQKGLKSFVGFANYFRDHIQNHSSRVEPLTRIMDGYSPSAKIEWNERTIAAFEDIKKGINECPALFFVDYDAPVHLYTDASLIGIGAYVAQPIKTKLVPIAFFSASLTKEEKEWGIPCLEGYAIYRAFIHFDYLLRDVHTDVYTDHKNLVYIKEARESKVIRWKMELQEYSFTPAFIPGKDNPIADFWSRNPLAEVDDFVIDEPAKANNMFNAITASEQDISEQEDYTIDSPSQVLRMLNDWQISESSIDDKEETAQELNAIKAWKTFHIPQAEYEKLQAVHNKLTGHHGVENTLRKLHLQGHKWPFMREHARRFIKECDVCQKYSFTGCEVHIPRYISGRYLPMERVAIDLIELPKSKINRRGEPEDRVVDEDGNTCILAIIDCFSRFLGLYPIKSKAANDCANALNIHCGFFGTPCEIMGDDGFVNKIIQEYLNLLGTEHVIMMAHSHEENSIVERSNKETWRWLTAILHDKKVGRHRITKSLPFVTRIHNSTVKKSFHYSPAQIIFGDRVDLDHSILLPHTAREENLQLESEWMQERMEVQDVILDLATKYQQAHDEQNRVSRTTTGTENKYTDFPKGSFVLLAYPTNTMTHNRRPDKLHMMFRGPYEVVNRDHNEFTIKNLIDGREEKKSIFMLRPFHYDPARTDPKVIALNDYDNEFFVEEILGHEGNWSRKRQMTFKVRWLGYNETYDTWEPWNAVKNNTVFHAYLHQVGRSKLIPS